MVLLGRALGTFDGVQLRKRRLPTPAREADGEDQASTDHAEGADQVKGEKEVARRLVEQPDELRPSKAADQVADAADQRNRRDGG